jgi:signal transduction histidine kinase
MPVAPRLPLWLQITLLVGVAGTAPLATIGLFGLGALRAATRREIEAKNQHAALRAAELIRRHVLKYREMLIALGGTVENSVHLDPGRVERVLKNHLLDVADFRAIDLVAPDGGEVATGRADGRTRSRLADPAFRAAATGANYFSPVRIGDRVEPEMVLAVPVGAAPRVEGVLIATLNLTEMWSLVEQMALDLGTTKVVDGAGRLIAASGDRDKEAVFELSTAAAGALGGIGRDQAARVVEYADPHGERVLGAAAPIPELGWGVILEQPTRAAFAAVREQVQRLALAVAVFLVVTVLVGAYGARLVTRSLALLTARTREIAQGRLRGRVDPGGARELVALGAAIDHMSEELDRLQEQMRARERMSTFARFGAGLVHDLGTPIKAVQINAMLAVHAGDDAVRAGAVERLLREQRVIERYLQLLRSYARGEAIELRPVLVEAADFVAAVSARIRERWPNVTLESAGAPTSARFYADPGFLERVVENLAKNAVEAMAGRADRRLRLGVEQAEGVPTHSPTTVTTVRTILSIGDTGPGIPPERMATLYEPFRSSKSNGLGIGLALSRWIVIESGGSLTCESKVGEGTTFRISLPNAPPALQPVAAA